MKKGKYQIMQERRDSAIGSIRYYLKKLPEELRTRQMEDAEYSIGRIESEIAEYRRNLPEYKEPESLFVAMVEEFNDLVAPIKATKRDAALDKEAARIKGENAATDKQIAYLVSLGYSYDGSYLSKADASAKIEEYKARQQRDYLAKELLKAAQLGYAFRPHTVVGRPALWQDKQALESAVEFLLSEGYITLVEPSDAGTIYSRFRLTQTPA